MSRKEELLRMQYIVKLLKDTDLSNKKILDLGGGEGNLKKFLPHSEVTVVDLDEKLLLKAKRKGCKTVRWDLNKTPLPLSKKFDVIVCTEVLEHLIDPKSLLREIRRMIKSEGTVILSMPNNNVWQNRLQFLLGKSIDVHSFDITHIGEHHFHFPNYKQIIFEVSRYFQIEKIKGYPGEGKIWGKIPRIIRDFLANNFPTLFAVSVIVKGRKK